MAELVQPALRALLARSIDYAGLFPPASLRVADAVANYREYESGEFAWMLGRFVALENQLADIPADLDRQLAVIAESDHPRASAIETKLAIATAKPTYCEAPLHDLDAVARAGKFAKLRTGGVSPDAIPSIESVAAYLHACATRRLPFKATAGMHRPIRSNRPLTYKPDAACSVMHGFINFLVAAAFAWDGATVDTLRGILAETGAGAFRFSEAAHWRDRSLDLGCVVAARRNFVHSFGSCSFLEPIEGLKDLNWL